MMTESKDGKFEVDKMKRIMKKMNIIKLWNKACLQKNGDV
jgi:hypothetical protein